MKKNAGYILLILLSISLNSALFAQEAEWGDLNVSETKNYFPTIIGEDENGIYTFASYNNDYIIEKYDKRDKTLEFSKVVDQPKIGKNRVSLERVLFNNGKFIGIASYYDKGSSTSNIYGFFIDAETGRTKKSNVILKIPVEKKFRRGEFYVHVSDDKTKILVNHWAYFKKDKAYRNYIVLLDENLEILLDKEEEIKRKDDGYSATNWIIDNDGSVYYLKSYDKTEHYIVSYEVTREYEKWEERLEVKDMKKDEVITNVKFTINANNNLILTGYYAQKYKLYGCFFMKIDNFSKEVVNSKITEFDKNFRDQFLTERQAKKGKEAKLYNVFNDIEIIQKEDGGVILIGELFQYHLYEDANGNSSGESYYYGDLIVLNLSNDGTLLWSNRMPKRQLFTVSWQYYPFYIGSFGVSVFRYPSDIIDYFSYIIGVDDKNLYLFYNDSPKNIPKSDREKPTTFKKIQKSVVMVYKMDIETGKKDKDVFYDIKNTNIYLKPVVRYQATTGSDVIIFGKKGKKYCYGTITL